MYIVGRSVGLVGISFFSLLILFTFCQEPHQMNFKRIPRNSNSQQGIKDYIHIITESLYYLKTKEATY